MSIVVSWENILLCWPKYIKNGASLKKEDLLSAKIPKEIHKDIKGTDL